MTIGSVSIDAASSPLFAPGSSQCIGMDLTHPGEGIYLDVAAVPEPTTWALLGVGLTAIAWRRRSEGV